MGQYAYLDMDKAIAAALDEFDQLRQMAGVAVK